MRNYFYILSLLAALLVALPFSKAKADDAVVEDDQDPAGLVTWVTLAWDQGHASDVAGYNVYYGRASGDYTRLDTVTEQKATIGVRGRRTVYFAVTAFNADGAESPFSEEVHWP